MKKLLTPLLLSLVSLNLSAQKAKHSTVTKTAPPQANYAVLRGHIENHAEPVCEIYSIGFMGYLATDIPVDANGNFSTRIKVEGKMMDVQIAATSHYIFLRKNDTVTCNWDARNARQTFKASSPNAELNNNLQVLANLNNAWNDRFLAMSQSFYDNQTADSAKFAAINTLYNQEIETLSKGKLNEGLNKIAVDVYFKYAMLLQSHNMLPAYQLKLLKPVNNSQYIEILTDKSPYANEQEEWFLYSYNYRRFLLDYVKFSYVIKNHVIYGNPAEIDQKSTGLSVPRSEFNSGLNNLYINEIRDWYTATTVINSFSVHPFEHCVDIYKDFLARVKTPFYADTVKKFFQSVQRLKPGLPAPGFTLKDENGNMVSLSQFKGKMVYIDFWGVGCGPCIAAIKQHVPALHQRYKGKNIVFLNVCVDAGEPAWKVSLKELDVHGVNLIAQGWTKHPTVKAYNVSAIPHYVLIDTKGNIIDNNSRGPSPKLYPLLDEILK